MFLAYSSIQQYCTCPRQYYETRIARSVKREVSNASDWGNAVHDAAEARTLSPTYDPPPGMNKYIKPVDKVRENLEGYNIYTEYKLAIDEHFQPTQYMNQEGGLYRGKLDLLALNSSKAVVIDWKTGKVKEDVKQLQFYAILTLINHPEVEEILTSLVWLKYRQTTKRKYTREDLPNLLALFLDITNRMKADTKFLPVQSGLCKKHCPVVSCKYNGRKSQ